MHIVYVKEGVGTSMYVRMLQPGECIVCSAAATQAIRFSIQ
jgi:hypothetical protein